MNTFRLAADMVAAVQTAPLCLFRGITVRPRSPHNLAGYRRTILPLLGERESLWAWNILPEMLERLEINSCIFGS